MREIITIHGVDHLLCGQCQQLLPIDEFHKNHTRKFGRQYFCKACAIARVKANAHARNQQAIALLTTLRDQIDQCLTALNSRRRHTPMAKLNAARRNKLPKSDFALPGKGKGKNGKGSGSYPIPNASHARNALARVSQHGTPAEKSRVRAAVKRKFPNIKVKK